MRWELIGGNPAPGNPESINKLGVSECRRISEAASSAVSNLTTIGDGLSGAVWQGEAADVFAKRLPDTVADLQKVETSYRQVGDALGIYARRLVDLQDRAEIALDRAVDAQRRIRKYRETKQTHTLTRDGLSQQMSEVKSRWVDKDNQVRFIARERLTAEQLARTAVDPTEQAAQDARAAILANQEAQVGAARDSLRLQLTQLNGKLADAKQDVARATRFLEDARDDKQSAVDDAGRIREDARTAGDVAADAVQNAKRDAIGNAWDRFRHHIRESKPFKLVLAFVEGFASELGTLSLLLTTLAAITAWIPILNGAFAAAIAVVAGLSALMAAVGFALQAFNGRSSGWGLLLSGVSAGLSVVGASSALRTARGIATPVASGKGADSVLKRASQIVRGKTGQIRNNLNLTYFKTTIGGHLYKGYADDFTLFKIVKSTILPGGTRPSQFFNSVFTRAGTETLTFAAEKAADKAGHAVSQASDHVSAPHATPTTEDIRERLRAILLRADEGVLYGI